MKRLMHYFMLSCKKAASLIDKKADVQLSWKENMQLTMHKSMCDACTAYEKQSKLIDKALHDNFHAIQDDVNTLIENKELQQKIISKLWPI